MQKSKGSWVKVGGMTALLSVGAGVAYGFCWQQQEKWNQQEKQESKQGNADYQRWCIEYEKNRVKGYLDWKKMHPEYGNDYDDSFAKTIQPNGLTFEAIEKANRAGRLDVFYGAGGGLQSRKVHCMAPEPPSTLSSDR